MIFDVDTYRQCRRAERMRKSGSLFASARIVYKTPPGPVRFTFPVRDFLVLPPARHRIIREVCHKHGLDVEHVLSDRRTRPLVEARVECYCRLYVECPEMSLPAIGRAMGGRDHTTVLHSIRKYGHLHGITYREGGRGNGQG